MTGIELCLRFRQPLEAQINAGEKKEGKEDEPSTAAPVPGTGKAVDFAKISIEEAFTTLKVCLTATGQLQVLRDDQSLASGSLVDVMDICAEHRDA